MAGAWHPLETRGNPGTETRGRKPGETRGRNPGETRGQTGRFLLLFPTWVGTAGAYTYDGNNLRVKKVAAATITVYIFSGSKVIAEYDNGAAPASPSREYIYSGTALLAKIEAGASIYYHPDHLSNRVLTDSTGNVLGQRGHYPFGDTWRVGGKVIGRPAEWQVLSSSF